MRFEIGKYYKHSGGGPMLHIVCATKTTMWGWALIAEEVGSSLKAVGSDKSSAVNWTEATEEEWSSHFS